MFVRGSQRKAASNTLVLGTPDTPDAQHTQKNHSWPTTQPSPPPTHTHETKTKTKPKTTTNQLKIPGQRAAALKFAAEPARNLYFWLQEPAASGDAALIAQVHAALNTPLGDSDDGDDEGMAVDEGGALGDAPAQDALLRGALAT
jgi:hypothetical protein